MKKCTDSLKPARWFGRNLRKPMFKWSDWRYDHKQNEGWKAFYSDPRFEDETMRKGVGVKLLWVLLFVFAVTLLASGEYTSSVGFFISSIFLAIAFGIYDECKINMAIKDRQLAAEREYRYVCVDNFIKQKGIP